MIQRLNDVKSLQEASVKDFDKKKVDFIKFQQSYELNFPTTKADKKAVGIDDDEYSKASTQTISTNTSKNANDINSINSISSINNDNVSENSKTNDNTFVNENISRNSFSLHGISNKNIENNILENKKLNKINANLARDNILKVSFTNKKEQNNDKKYQTSVEEINENDYDIDEEVKIQEPPHGSPNVLKVASLADIKTRISNVGEASNHSYSSQATVSGNNKTKYRGNGI